jgi:hypothetical protein
MKIQSNIGSQLFCLAATRNSVLVALSDLSDSSNQSNPLVQLSPTQSKRVQPNPAILPHDRSSIGKETVKFLAIFDHQPSCHASSIPLPASCPEIPLTLQSN